MDMLVGFIQIVCICGLLYGLYLSITYVGPEAPAQSRHRSRPRHFAYDPLVADGFAASRPASAERVFDL